MRLKPCLWAFFAICDGSALAADPADLVVRGANVLTVDASRPRAEAFAVAGGKFVDVGSDRDMAALIGPRTQILELTRRTVVPGFVDAHLHPGPVHPPDSRWAAVDCSPKSVRTIDELVAALARKAARPPAGKWVDGSRSQETKLGRHPT